MSEITPEKTHQLLEKLAEYVMTEVSTKAEVNQKISQIDEKIDQKISQVDEKIDKLADYVMNEVPTKMELQELKDKVDTIINGIDKQAGQLDIIRTEQVSFNQAFKRLETRVEKFEKVH